MLIMQSGLGLLRRLCTLGLHLTLYFHLLVSRLLRSLHTLIEVLDLVLAYVYDLVEVRVGSPVGTSNHSVIFIDALLEVFTRCVGSRSI